MSNYTKMGDLVEVPPVQTVVCLDDGTERPESVLNSFVFTSEVDAHFSVLADALMKDTGRGFFLQGDFGSGKSHFLAVLSTWLSKRPGSGPFSARRKDLDRITDSDRKFLAVDISLVKYRATTSLERIIIESAEASLTAAGSDECLTPRSAFLTDLNNLLKDPNLASEFAAQAGIDSEAIGHFTASDPRQAYIQGVRFYKAIGIGAPETLVEERHETFERAMGAVERAGFGGLVLIIDELSEFFRSKPDARALNEDARTLQLLGELSQTRPVWIIAAVQESIERTGDISQVTFRKIKDRFPVKFVLSTVHIKALISQRLVRRKPGADEALGDIYKYIRKNFASFDHAYEDFLAYYPVHPATISLLDGLGDLFSEHRGIVDFVHSQLAGDPGRRIPGILDRPAYELLGPDSIYDHFRHRIAEFSAFNIYSRHIIPHFEQIIEQILDTPDDRELANRLVRILALHAIHPTAAIPPVNRITEWVTCAVWEHDPKMNIRFVAEAILDPLAERSRFLVKHPSESGDPLEAVYEISTKEDPAKALRARIERAAAEIPPDDARLLTLPLSMLEESPSWPGVALFHEGLLRLVNWRRTNRRAWVGFAAPGREAGLENELREKLVSGDADFAVVFTFSVRGAPVKPLPDEADNALAALQTEHIAVWEITIPAEEGPARALREFLAARTVADGLKGTSPAEAPLVGPAGEALERLAPAAFKTALDAFYSGRFSDRRIQADPVIQKLKRFDRLIEWAGELILEIRYPGFRDVAPRKVQPSSLTYQRIIDEFVFPGTLSLQKAHARGLADAIEGLAKPLGLVELRSGSYVFSPDPENHPLLSTVFGLIHAAGNTRTDDVLRALRTGRFGLPSDTARFLLSALAHGGLVTLLKNNRAIPIENLGMTRIENADSIAPGEVIGKHARETLMAQCHFLAPPQGWESFGLRQQREAWQNTLKFRAWAARAGELEQNAASLSEYSAFESFDIESITAKLAEIRALADEIKTSLQAREGLERFLSAWEMSGLRADDIHYLRKFQSFLARHKDRFMHIAHYTRGEAVNAAVSEDADLSVMKRGVEAFLTHPETLIARDDMPSLDRAFDRFRETYVRFYRERHDRFYRQSAGKPLSRFAGRALALLKQMAAIESLDRPKGLDVFLKSAEAPSTAECKKNLSEELVGSPVCGCGYMPGQSEADGKPQQDIEPVIERMLAGYIEILGRPEIRDAMAARVSALKDARPEDSGRLGNLSALIHGKNPSPAAMLDVMDGHVASEISEALSGRVAMAKRNVGDLVFRLSGRRLGSDQIMEAVREWVADTDKNTVIAVEYDGTAPEPGESASLDWWPLMHRSLFRKDPARLGSPDDIRTLESILEKKFPPADLRKTFASADDETVLAFITEERFHTHAVRTAWLVLAERILAGTPWPAGPVRSRHADLEIAGGIDARLAVLTRISDLKNAGWPDRLRARVPLSAILADAWVSDDLRTTVFDKNYELGRKGADWLSALPALEPIDLSAKPVVIILDGVSPDVWLDALEGLDAGPDTNSWSRLEADPETPAAMAALFGFAGDPFDEFPVRGIDYFQVKGNEEHALSDLLPEFDKDNPIVIRVSLVDEGAHGAFLRLAEMPGAVAGFLNASFPYLKDTCARQKRKLVLTADHGLSLTKGGLRHGKGGVFEKALFRSEWG